MKIASLRLLIFKIILFIRKLLLLRTMISEDDQKVRYDNICYSYIFTPFSQHLQCSNPRVLEVANNSIITKMEYIVDMFIGGSFKIQIEFVYDNVYINFKDLNFEIEIDSNGDNNGALELLQKVKNDAKGLNASLMDWYYEIVKCNN